MLINYLILCHKCPDQVNQLIGSLSVQKGAEFFVHVDAKSSFDIESLKREHVHICAKRKRIDWGTYSIVDATQTLIEDSLRIREAEYYVLLSGQDYPIKSPVQFEGFLAESIGTNYIEVIGEDNPLYRRFAKRNEVPFHPVMMKRNFMSRVVKHSYICLTGGFSRTLHPRKTPFLQSYYGSQWWVLHNEFIKYAVRYLNENNEFKLFFESSLVPDESFYQTLIMNSPFSNTVAESLTFVNWKNDKNNPEPLLLEDFETLKASERKFFARKMDYEKSAGLVDVLNESLLLS